MSKPSTAEMLAKCASEIGLNADQQIVALAGFLCQSRPSIDPEKLTDGMASLLEHAGLPLVDGVALLCGLVDREGKPEEFFAFLSTFAKEFVQPQFQVAPPPPEAVKPAAAPPVKVPILVNPIIFQRVAALLSEGKPMKDMDLGHVIHRFAAQLQGLAAPLTNICVDVVNADAGPQLDPYIMHQSACVASGASSRDLAKSMLILYAGVRFEVLLVSSDAGQL